MCGIHSIGSERKQQSLHSRDTKLEIRLGGIYALERIAKDSPEDYWPIMEVLCTYVREQASNRKDSDLANQVPIHMRHPSADIQAILTVLGRRDRKYEKQEQFIDLASTRLTVADLSGADLSGADLSGADLAFARLEAAQLEGTLFFGADLRTACLHWANLSRADLSGAKLEGASFYEATLSGANFSNSDYQGITEIDHAGLRGANLCGADLSGVVGLTQDQLDSALGDRSTQLPSLVHMPESWKK